MPNPLEFYISEAQRLKIPISAIKKSTSLTTDRQGRSGNFLDIKVRDGIIIESYIIKDAFDHIPKASFDMDLYAVGESYEKACTQMLEAFKLGL